MSHYWSEFRSVVRSVVDTSDQWSDRVSWPLIWFRSGQVGCHDTWSDSDQWSHQVRSGVMTTDLTQTRSRSGVMTTDLVQVGCHDHWSDSGRVSWHLIWPDVTTGLNQIRCHDTRPDLTWTRSVVKTPDLTTDLGCQHLIWPLIWGVDTWCDHWSCFRSVFVPNSPLPTWS